MWQLGLAQLPLPRLGLILCKLNMCKLCHRANLPVTELGHHGSLPAETQRPSPTHVGGWMGWMSHTSHTVCTPTRCMRHSQRQPQFLRLKVSQCTLLSLGEPVTVSPTPYSPASIQCRNHYNSFIVSAGWQLSTCHGVTNWLYRGEWEWALPALGIPRICGLSTYHLRHLTDLLNLCCVHFVDYDPVYRGARSAYPSARYG